MQEDTRIENYVKDGFKILVEATKSSNLLPTDQDWTYYNVHDSFKRIMDEESNRILGIMNFVLRKQGIEENIRNRGLQEKTELVIEANDVVLEKVANNIDEINGIKKNRSESIEIHTVSAQLPVNGSWNRLNKATFSVNPSPIPVSQSNNLKSVTLLTAKNIAKPQKFFKDKIDNSNDRPWMPRITEKPNSLKPLAIFLEETAQGPAYSHPYEFELEKFTPCPEQLKESLPVVPKPLEETPLYEVNTPEELDNLLEELRKHTEIAIDLEHHSYRSFMGITCLLQVSTKDADYLIDTLALRDKLYILNEVFTKPTIVKIFHGAILDIEWLQRDLSLYIVNMFDTHFAAKQLEYSGLSLSYLMERFCKIKPNKHFQLADWRIRPLPDELKTYARMDTHYLIYIYHMMKNELLQKANHSDNLLKSVIQKSTQLCMRRYIKPILKEDSYLDFYRKCKRIFDNRQMYALKELYCWRDAIAREEDESTGYVLPNHMLLQISETLPREMQGILACCNPIPTLVRANLLELHQFILQAREQPLVKPILKEGNRSRGSTLQIFKINIESPLHCPHDLSKQQEFRDDLPTLIGNNLMEKVEHEKEEVRSYFSKEVTIEKVKSAFSVFDSDNAEIANKKMSAKIKKLKFLGPFERYKLVKPYIAAEDAKEKEEKDKQENEEKDRTNEERIATLLEHFKKVSKLAPQKLPQADAVNESSIGTVCSELVSESVLENTDVGGKKRKREHQEETDSSLSENITIKQVNPRAEEISLTAMGGKKKKRYKEVIEPTHISYNVPKDSFHTPIPNLSKKENDATSGKKRSRKRKRKASRNYNSYTQQQQKPNKNSKHDGNHHPEKRKKININKKNQESNLQKDSNKPLSKRQQRNLARAAKFRELQRKESRIVSSERRYLPGEQSDSFKPFDYSSVDYGQFVSHAKSANENHIRSKFKGKGKDRKRGNNQSKSMTFKSNPGQSKTKQWI